MSKLVIKFKQPKGLTAVKFCDLLKKHNVDIGAQTSYTNNEFLISGQPEDVNRFLKETESTENDMETIFEDLLNNERKTIRLDLSGCMGGGTKGMTTFKRVRKGKAKTFYMGGNKGKVTRQSVSLMAEGQVKWKPHSGYRLWRSVYEDGSVGFSASVGNMGIVINSFE